MQLRAGLRGAAPIVAATAVAAASLPAFSAEDDFVLKFSADLMSDSIARGITQTAHRPGVTGTVDLQKSWFYVTTEISNVKPPTSPAAEVAVGGGIRPEIAGHEDDVEIDIGVLRYSYPGATPLDATGSGGYTEAEASIIYKYNKYFTLGAEVAYSPDVSNTGARSWHSAGHVKFDFSPYNWLPQFDSYYLWGKLGRVQSSTVSSALGGYQLPSYTHWILGAGLKHKAFTLEVNYTNTTLSRENCYIITGDPAASAGGMMTDANPLGLRSNWCSQAVHAKLSFEFPPDKK
jgi:uncharacterized protein (TIGR02001 family)